MRLSSAPVWAGYWPPKLAEQHLHVTILERDTLPETAESRKGVPQERHAHALLPSGRGVLETLFPGLSQELVAQGAILADSAQSALCMINGSYHCRFQSGVQSLFVSRPRLETYKCTANGQGDGGEECQSGSFRVITNVFWDYYRLCWGRCPSQFFSQANNSICVVAICPGQ